MSRLYVLPNQELPYVLSIESLFFSGLLIGSIFSKGKDEILPSFANFGSELAGAHLFLHDGQPYTSEFLHNINTISFIILIHCIIFYHKIIKEYLKIRIVVIVLESLKSGMISDQIRVNVRQNVVKASDASVGQMKELLIGAKIVHIHVGELRKKLLRFGLGFEVASK